MARKTRKRAASAASKGVSTIPELRRSFEYVEKAVDDMIHSHDSREEMIRSLRKEWRQVFHRELSKEMAEAFIEHRVQEKKDQPSAHRRRRHTQRHTGGMAPLDYTTRAGVYLAPGQIPTAQGHLPLSSGAASAFGSFTEYISKGFWNPEIAPPGEAQWPVPMKGGARARKPRRTTGGNLLSSSLSQAFMRPFGSSDDGVPSVLSDMQRMYNGSKVGDSPDQTQRAPVYSK